MAGMGHEQDGASAVPVASPPGLRQDPGAPGGVGQGAAVGLNFQRATRQYIETEILLVNDRMVVDIPGEEVEGGQAWQELVKTLRVLGFDLSKKDGWELLGLPKFDGPDPDKATVLRRAGLVDDLLDKANDTVLEPEEQAKRLPL